MDNLLHKAKGFVADHVIKPVETVTHELKEQSSKGVKVHVKIPVKNPLCFAIPMGKFTYSLKSGGREIGSGMVDDPGSLEARVVTWLDVLVHIPLDILVSITKDIAADWDIDYEMEVCIMFDVLFIHDIGIPVSHSGTLKLPSMSSIMGGGSDGGD